jgi:signal transduction histidine kinase
MWRSLNFRLLAAFTLIILVIIGAAFFFAYRTTYRQLVQIQGQLEDIQDNRVESELVRFFQFTRTWDGVQPYVIQMGNLYGRRIVITDPQNVIVADSAGELLGQTYQDEDPGTAISAPMVSPGRTVTGTVAYVHILPENETDINRAALAISYNSISRFFLWGGLLAILVAVLLATFLSRRILAPVRDLTRAATRFGKGDFSSRVTDEGSGEIAELTRSFNSMAQNLTEAEQRRRALVADIAHELRTPLSNLRGYLEAINDGVVKPDETTIRSLAEEAGALSHLVSDLQELSLADAGALKLDLQTADISDIINATVTAVQPKAAGRGLAVNAAVAPDLPPVYVDVHRIRQVLQNLLENAVAHTESGGTITVTAHQRAGFISVAVADTGEGIPPEDLNYIFERFYRVDKSRTRATGGTGLGLTIARRLVEAHGGTIGATSVPGSGATFTFTLPLEPSPEGKKKH